MKKGWSEVALGGLAHARSEFCAISPEGQYQEVTVSLWGKELVYAERCPVRKLRLTNRNVARAGDFIISKIDARNGRYGFIPPELDGAVVTNDFPLILCLQERLRPPLDVLVSRSNFFVDLCRSSSEGTTNRMRLKESSLLKCKSPCRRWRSSSESSPT